MPPYTLEKLLGLAPILGAVAWFAFRYIGVPLLLSIINDLIRPKLTRTETELITWLHFQKHAQGDRHKAENVVACADDDCVRVGPNRT